ncbi:MAG: Ig domain-containing protein [Pseudomonadota bacterium]
MRRIQLSVVAAAALALLSVPAASALDLVAEPNVLPDAVVGEPYHFEFEGEEGCPPSYDFHLHNGYLPPGLEIERTTGELEGTPTVPGDYHFFVELTDGSGPGACNSTPSQADFYVRVLPRLEVTTASLGPVRAGTSLDVQLTAAGGGTQSWSVVAGTLPGGLTLSSSGRLTGYVGGPGSSTFTVRVQDPGPRRTGDKQYTLVVAGPVSLAVAAAGASEVGVPLRATPTATGGAAPYAWSVSGALPPGVTLDAATGALAGTPTAAGSYRATLTVTDAVGYTATADVAVTVARRLQIATRTVRAATVGTAYRARVVTRGGVGPLRWTIRGTLQRGLRFDRRTGTFAGVARAAGTRRVTVTVRDRLGVVATRRLVVTAR